jgi:hypothetical protein
MFTLVRDAFDRLEEASQKMGLIINFDKTKYIETTCKPKRNT